MKLEMLQALEVKMLACLASCGYAMMAENVFKILERSRRSMFPMMLLCES
jgi:hypothetical protein